MRDTTVLLWLSLALAPRALVGQRDSTALLSTGITGTLTVSGLASPTYLLSFRPVQRLVLTALANPVARATADSMVVGTPVSVRDLLEQGVLRDDHGRLGVGYLVLSTEDQRAIHRVAARLGPDLARAFTARAREWNAIVAAYPDSALRPALAFDLVAGIVLNWDGLALTSELGYRATPISQPNGDRFLFHSKEVGAHLDVRSLYWGSESWPGPSMTFTTLGDAESFPRTLGLPNTYESLIEQGLEPLRGDPALYGAVRSQVLTYFGDAIADEGAILEELARAPRSKAELRTRLGLSNDRVQAAIRVLDAIGYVHCETDGYHLGVPVLIERDRALVDRTVALGREIMTAWLGRHSSELRRELAGLGALRAGLPFELVFSEVWHYVFGFATKELAESGFYLNPRAPGRRTAGYLGFVWKSSLYRS